MHLGGNPVRGCTGCRKCAENKDNRCIMDDDIIIAPLKRNQD